MPWRFIGYGILGRTLYGHYQRILASLPMLDAGLCFRLCQFLPPSSLRLIFLFSIFFFSLFFLTSNLFPRDSTVALATVYISASFSDEAKANSDYWSTFHGTGDKKH
mmetsp:Transcript_38223/g.77849  ORF Transcript_38223/g.77849 Transcript_38223/m.77849 type:complete len:107 (+) Transcript_38223:423-743(+)